MDENNPNNQEPLEKQKLDQLGNELENLGKKAAQEIPPQPSQPVQQPDASQPISPTPPIEAKPQRLSKSKGVLWTGVVLMALALVGVGAYYLGSRKTAITSIPESVSVQTPTPTTDPTADWKTYRNDKLLFSFKYLPNYSFEEMPKEDASGWQIHLGPDENNLFTIEILNKYLSADVEYFLETEASGSETFNGISWKTYYLPKGYADANVVGAGQPIFGLQLEKNQILYSLTFHSQSELTKTQQQILSTFEFIDEQAFVCPEEKTIDCMPSVDGPLAKYCASDYAEWIGENCPDVGIAY